MINLNRTTAALPSTAISVAGTGGAAWSNPTNVFTDNATDTVFGAFAGGQQSEILRITNFGFNIPNNAVIDGILVFNDISFRSGEYMAAMQLRTNSLTSNNKATFANIQATYGGSTDTWGMALTPAIVNGSDFGVEIACGDVSGGDAVVQLDYVQITVYWHYDATVPAAEVPLRYDHKIYSPSGTYLGNLPNVVSEFETSQDINSAGSQLSLEVASNNLNDAQPALIPGNLLQWLPGAWTYRSRISVLRSKVTGTVTDFPMLIDLSKLDSNFWTNVKTNGDDVRMTDAYGILELPFELVNFNKAAKTGLLWFKAPRLTTDYDSFFYIYYGNASASAYAASATYGSQNVWAAYKGAWHLEEAASTTASAYKDQSPNANHGTGTSMSQAAVAGKVGTAADFDGVDDVIGVTGSLGLGNTSITMSGWAYVGNLNQHGAFWKFGTTGGYAVGQGSATVESNGSNLIMLFEGIRWIPTSYFFPSTGWYFIHMVIDASGVPSVYVNGALNAAYSGTNGSSPTGNSYIGAGGVANRFYPDPIDEVRVATVARNAAWIAAEYANQNNPATFSTIDPPQSQTALGYTPLLKNGNLINVYESSYYYPNGKLMFQGQLNRIQASFDPQVNSIVRVLCHSDGRDLDNMVARGAPFSYTNDQSQATQNSRVSNISYLFGGWERQGQSFTTGAAVTNIGRIQLMLDGIADVTVSVYTNSSLGTLVGSVTRSVNVAGPTVVDFAFADMLSVSASTSYFFTIATGNNQSIWVHFSSANPYASGARYNSSYAGGSGGGAYGIDSGNDIYFTTASGTPSTQATYTAKDPTTQMLKPIIDDYRLRGGLINYNDVLSTVDATGLSLTITFNTNTIFEAIKKILDMSPSAFYYYVDLGTNTLWFKETSRTADFILVKGRHVGSLELVFSIENVINDLLFSGGEIAGVNLYAEYSDGTSRGMYGQRLDRKSDNRVTVLATADAIGNSKVTALKDEQQSTAVAIPARTMDITLVKPGKTIGFRGYGNFIDNLLLQITKVQYNGRQVVVQLGTVPIRFDNQMEQVLRGLLQEQTISNPSTPN